MSNMIDMRFKCPVHFEKKIRSISGLRKIPMSRLITIAIDHELHKESGLFDQRLKLPDLSECEEFEYADEAGKIATFLKGVPNGTGLDVMMVLRYEIGIQCRERFLGGFKELLNTKMIEEFKPIPRSNRPPFAEDYVNYRMVKKKEKGADTPFRAKRFATYQRLKKEFKGE